MFSKKISKGNKDVLTTPESETKKPFPWGKYIYLAILYSLITFGLYWIYVYHFEIRGDGVLSARTVEIAPRHHARISRAAKRVLDPVKRDEALVELDDIEISLSLEMERYRKKRLIGEHETRLEELEEEIRRTFRQNPSAPAGENEPGSRDAFASGEFERTLSDSRIRWLRARKKDLERSFQDTLERIEKEIYRLESLSREFVLRSPVDGLIVSQHKRTGEVAKIGEPIYTVAENTVFFVLAYFPQKHLGKIVPGTEVLCVFENGIRLHGTVDRVAPRSHALPGQFKREYGVSKEYIEARIAVTAPDTPDLIGSRVKVRVL
jgi:multidrug resistance efflux pump